MTRRGFLGWLAGLFASVEAPLAGTVAGGRNRLTGTSPAGRPAEMGTAFPPAASTPCQRRVIRFGVPVQGLEGQTGSIVYRCWREIVQVAISAGAVS